MPRIAREIDAAVKAVSIARLYFHTEEPAAAAELDIQLWKLLKRGSPVLRTEMAEQLAQVENGPRRTLRALACDPDPEVAGPVLRGSQMISDAAISEMARCKGDGHLLAIAHRRNLSSQISGILARRGGPAVLDALARNLTATFSGPGRVTLVHRLRQFERSRLKSALRAQAHAEI
jgi:uncharacterized protein (DUF2336 family)